MTADAMASRMGSFRPLVSEFKAALTSFQDSGSKFRILKTINPTTSTPESPSIPSSDQSPKTLFILDSSFNPPSIAHQYIGRSALHKSSSDHLPKPHRMLLLFATMNADKAPSAASFEQRLTLMSIFACDLIDSMRTESNEYSIVPVDIGVTTTPLYTDKSAAIETEGSQWYPASPKHVHLIGYDTITRLFSTKYYQKFDPPLSALNPYFDAGHRLNAILRPDDDYGSVEEQKKFLKNLEDGEFEKDGGKREWARQIEMVPPNPKTGVSSTKIRAAAKRRDWEELAGLATPNVATWIQTESLYEDDDKGAKMA